MLTLVLEARIVKLNLAFSIFLRIGIVVCVPVFAQQGVPSSSLSGVDAQAAKTIQGIEDGDVNALGLAALSGNQIFVPYFKEQLGNPKAKLHTETSLLQVGLAKAGETRQLQQLSCELNFGDATTRYDSIRKVELVGGWFAIRNMAEFLKDNPRYRSRFGEGLGPMQDYALQSLAKLVPPPPPSPPQSFGLDNTKVVGIWHDYLDAHHDSLSKLPPTEEGVNISEGVCKRVLKYDPAIHRKKKRREKPPLLAE